MEKENQKECCGEVTGIAFWHWQVPPGEPRRFVNGRGVGNQKDHINKKKGGGRRGDIVWPEKTKTNPAKDLMFQPVDLSAQNTMREGRQPELRSWGIQDVLERKGKGRNRRKRGERYTSSNTHCLIRFQSLEKHRKKKQREKEEDMEIEKRNRSFAS